MKTAGLDLDQAPPLHVPFRFFLAAPLFLLAAAWILALDGEAILVSRWTPASLAITHLITVGFLGQVMCGALLQMLPVIAGAPVPAVRPTGAAVNVLLSAGGALLGWGFLGGGSSVFLAGAVASFLGFSVFLVVAGSALVRAKGAASTVTAMRLAFGSLLVTISSGLLAAFALAGWLPVRDLIEWVDLHLSWGVLGWMGLLVVGVAYQVVPMFHVTPEYPPWLARGLAPFVGAGLAAGSLFALIGVDPAARAALGAAAGGFALFAVVTVRLQLRRQRKRIDVTLLYWWSAMASVFSATFAWTLGGPPVLTGCLLLIGVGVGVSSAMLFKIVPFLTWFHLQSRQLYAGRFDVRVPHMLAFLPERQARVQFACFLTALAGLAGATSVPELAHYAAWLLALSGAGLWGLMLSSALRFRRIASALHAERGASV